MPEKNEVWSSWYLSLFDDLSLGISDGVGYKDTMDKEDVIKLYKAMKGLIESSGEKPKIIVTMAKVKEAFENEMPEGWTWRNMAYAIRSLGIEVSEKK